MDRLVADVCGKQVVLLGEDSHHGSGSTLEAKAEIVERLIGECHFSAVFFESQVYDFIGLREALSDKLATPAQVADSIGGLWSTTAEMDPLIDYLFRAASDRQVVLAGLDLQTGGATNFYTQQRLPSRLARYLEGRERARCEVALHRLTNWEYDDESLYDDNAIRQLRSCLVDIQAGIAKHADTSAADSTFMASNLMQSLDMPSDAGLRDAAMYKNFLWLRQRLPANAKIVVWCATIHARKTGADQPGAATPMGAYIHELLGARAAAIGFSALSGSYGRMGRQTVELIPAAPDSLEGRALAHYDGPVRYVDSRQLHAYGKIAGRAIEYGKPQSRDWGDVIDGLVVLRQEQPPHYVHGAKPRQSPATVLDRP